MYGLSADVAGIGRIVLLSSMRSADDESEQAVRSSGLEWTLPAAGHVHDQPSGLAGPESLTKIEQMAAIGRGIGRELWLEELPVDRYRERLGAELAEVADFLLDIWANSVTNPDPVLPTVPYVRGRPARTVAEWAADHEETFQ